MFISLVLKILIGEQSIHHFIKAVRDGDIPFVIKYLFANLDDTFLDEPTGVNQVDDDRMTALMHAIVTNRKEIFNILIRFPNLNLLAKDSFKSNAFHWAARFGLNDFISDLVRCGVPLALINKRGYNAEDLAVLHGFRETADLIRDIGAGKKTYVYSRNAEEWMSYIAWLAKSKSLDINIEEIRCIPVADKMPAISAPQLYLKKVTGGSLLSKPPEQIDTSKGRIWLYHFHFNTIKAKLPLTGPAASASKS